MRALALFSLALLALAAPSVAAAAEPTIVAQDVPVGKARTLAATRPPSRFNLVGLHWRGPGSIDFRTRRVGGGWSPWRPAAPEAEDRPDHGGGERTRPGWRVGNPYWTSASDRIAYRLRGKVRRLRAWFVWSPPAPAPPRTLAVAGAPPIIPRLSWGANESLRRGGPSFAPALRLALVHHTAGANGYSRAQSPAVVRGVYLYHVRGNGWSDVGYNFLVDRYGQVFEGRFGGIARNVIGAHAQGFNTGSVGVSLLGNYGSAQPTPAARAALASLLAWRLDLAHVDPLSTLTAISAGNGRFPAGVPVFLRAVSGHRDTGFTACPGDALYRRINEVARAVSETGLPKLYAPAVRGKLGGPVRFTARLSEPLPWTVTISDGAGTRLAGGDGIGTAVSWTWDASSATSARGYRYTIAATDARSVTGTIGGPVVPVPLLAEPHADPAIVSPNGDGRGDSTTISYRLGATATVSARLVGPSGAVVAVLFTEEQAPGPNSFAFAPELVLDGPYRIVLAVTSSAGKRATATVPLLISRTLTGFRGAPRPFSPNGDRRRDSIVFRVDLAASSDVVLRILRRKAEAAVLFAGTLGPGEHALPWDGEGVAGRLLDGAYVASLELPGGLAATLPVRLDTRAPPLRLRSLRPLRLWLGERARLIVTADGRRRTLAAKPGTIVVPLPRPPRRLHAVAYDEAGNASRAIRVG